MHDKWIVQARDIHKAYGCIDAVRGVDLHMAAGEIVGLLGHNGAGKSTTVRMLAGLSRRDGGHLRVLGDDPDVSGPRIRSRTGYLAQRSVLDAELNVRDNLEVQAGYFGLRRTEARRRADELLAFAGLSGRARARVGSLSGGMARKLAIGRTLVNAPDLLLLDEPASGLDPQARQAVWSLLGELRARGVAQLLTTHHMEEAHTLCDRIVVLAGGRIIAEGTPQELIARHGGQRVLELRFRAGAAEAAAAPLARYFPGLHAVGDHLLIPTDDTESALATVRRAAVDFEAALVRPASLEDAYLALTVPEEKT
ncbi:ABC transporter ATP-binding protein [Streptomyces sp. QL37]|uniref:ABC transporter ATP-binding protein n=1 Tax=Streptomyces sp. QL37 TaxID=2093747 RepID=UPI000CF2ACA6|nr:ABC transporter ATP-binding protein [Streptomyces sp. QL37]PPQ61166.1 ABC transporter [Streptomyces sp. QL37]